MSKNLFLILLLSSLFYLPARAQNLISNGSFESDFANWNNLVGGGASATFSIETTDVQNGAKAMKVEVGAPGANAYDVQSINSAWASETGKTYTLSFYAKASYQDAELRVVQQTNTYAQQSFLLTTSWQKYEWTFTAQEANLQLRLNFPVAGTFFIDNINIPLTVPVQPPNLIRNGSFENDFANWTNLAGGGSSAAFTIETVDKFQGAKAMKVAIATAGANGYDVQSINSAWASETGKQYTLSFYAKASEAGKTLRVVQQTNTYSARDFSLTTAWQKYEWVFTAQENDLQLRLNFPVSGTFLIDSIYIPGTIDVIPPPYTPTGPPIATGNAKFLGSVYSNAQKVNFTAYFNQVTPENDGKWGVVEGTRNVMNWAGLDSAYKLAKDNGFPFKMHTLIWGSQQPAWIESLSPAEQLQEIEEWFAAVAARYPSIDFIEVVNEPINQPPNVAGNGRGNYINALGGPGVTGYDWIVKAFKLARQYFPTSRLMINEFNIVSSPARTLQYRALANLLKSENLIDAIGVQAHAFSTTAPTLTIKNSLDTLATTGLPLYATELDIDGLQNSQQLNAYQRIFPIFWEHPAIKGVTLWGHRPGHWRTNEGAYIVYSNGAERPAMVWLKEYIKGTTLLPITLNAFEARKSNNKVSLVWKTLNEVNNAYFIVERSNNGANYKPILQVKGTGTSQSVKEYITYDESPAIGLNYYRLAQVDVDGNKKYYGIRVVRFGDKKAMFIQVYPNPASAAFTIRTEPDIKKATITITDVAGRNIKTFDMPNTGIQTVNTTDLKNGIYYVRLNSNGQTITSKVIINNK